MQKLSIQGGTPLAGEVRVAGAKNAALPILTAALLTADPVRVSNMPDLNDVRTMVALLKSMGVKAAMSAGAVDLDASSVTSPVAGYELVKTMRASILALGPLTARCGEARVSLPGGCAIGERPVDLHIKGLSAMGAEISIEAGYIHAHAKRLKGARVFMDTVTVTGTENLMMAACLADGETVLENAAREPEVVDLAHCLIKMGARIRGHGTDVIVVEGVSELHGAEHSVMPDRIEAGTFLVGAAMTQGDVTLTRCAPGHLSALMAKLREAGAEVTSEDDWVRVRGPERPKAVNVTTDFYPGFPTDLQAQMMAMAAMSDGTSIITEQIYHDRFTHVAELNRLGARITLDNNVAVIEGRQQLSGAHVMATDLRASAALILAGLAARGETHMSRVYHIDRGYEHIEAKLAALGAVVRREQEAIVV